MLNAPQRSAGRTCSIRKNMEVKKVDGKRRVYIDMFRFECVNLVAKYFWEVWLFFEGTSPFSHFDGIPSQWVARPSTIGTVLSDSDNKNGT